MIRIFHPHLWNGMMTNAIWFCTGTHSIITFANGNIVSIGDVAKMIKWALKKYLKLFVDKGLCRVFDKSVTVAEKEIVAVCLQLNKVGALTYETVIDVLTGLTNCSVPDFMKLFDLSCSKPRWKPLTLILVKEIDLSRLRQEWVRSLMLTTLHSIQVAGWHQIKWTF